METAWRIFFFFWGGQDFATISILFNKGDGTWDAELIAEDVSSGVNVSRLELVHSDGSSEFITDSGTNIHSITDLAVVDFDGNGYKDILVNNSDAIFALKKLWFDAD